MNQVESKCTRRGRAWLVALSAAGFLFAVPDARASDEFEDGFKDELGRLAAHEAVSIGRGVLASILLGGHPGYYDYPDYPTHRPRYHHDDYDYPRYRPYPHWHYGHPSGYGYAPYHGHGWGHHHQYHHRHHHHHGCGD